MNPAVFAWSDGAGAVLLRGCRRRDDDPAQAAHGIGQIDRIGGFEAGLCQDLFARVGVRLQQMAAIDAGKQTRVDWRSEELAVAFDEDVAEAPSVNSPRSLRKSTSSNPASCAVRSASA